MSKTQEIGQIGEELALQYLEKSDYEILEKNWRYRKAEIDLICRKDSVLIFVEVKTRTSDFFGQPEEFISRRKEELMFAAANEYMDKIDHDWEIRFDCISVLLRKDRSLKKFDHLEDIFFPGSH